MAITYPKYGAEGGFIKTTKANRAEQAELQVGAHAEVLIKSTTAECSATKSDCSWGIEPDVSGTIFDSIRFAVEDELDPKFTAAQTSGTIDSTKPLVKVLNGCCLIKRAKGTLTISGKGDPGWDVGTTTTPSTMKPAIGTGIDIATVAAGMTGLVLRCQSYTVNASDTDWQNFSAEFVGYVDGTGASIALPLITTPPPNCSCSGGDGCCDTYKYETTITGTGYGETTVTKTSHEFAAA